MSNRDNISSESLKKSNRRDFFRALVRYPLMGALVYGGVVLACRSQSSVSNGTNLQSCRECRISRICLWKETK